MAISIAFKRCADVEFIGNLFHQFAGDGGLGQPVPAVYAVFANDMDPVGLAAHRVGGDIVGDDPVPSLAVELRPRMVDHAVGLGGNAESPRGGLGAIREAATNIGNTRE